jgi:LAO/AO transport system kinase
MSDAAGRRTPSLDEYAAGVLGGDRALLARAITLVESTLAADEERAQQLLERLLPHTGGAVRVGVSGIPGVGKSCLVEALGTHLTAQGRRVGVLAIDPTSPRSGGSILGDKTRMPRLAADPRAFIRPSPAGRAAGGVARATREALLLLEAAGHDVVLVETVGVGQSESAVRSMVDFFLLLLLGGAGDELQGMKRGAIELADALAVTKADGDNLARAELARRDYAAALKYLAPADGERPGAVAGRSQTTEGWGVEVLTCSAATGAGIAELWQLVERHRALGEATGALGRRRREQAVHWMHAAIAARLEDRFRAHPAVAALLPELERQVSEGTVGPTAAARRLLRALDE